MDTIDKIISLSESPLLEFAIKGALIYLAVLWFAMVVWVARDIVNRSNNILFQVSMILLNITLPVFGLVLYMILRPSRTLLEKYYDEMEYDFISEHALQEEHCKQCNELLGQDFLYCPSCSEKVRSSCASCKHVYLNQYIVCPYCGRKDGAKAIRKKGKKSSKKKNQEEPVLSEK
jgi:RNA polymerase subunit RPABC4/transcription elongation factor Spt4